MTERASAERAAALRVAEDPQAAPEVAVALCLLGHSIVRDGPRWTCTCGLVPRLGQGSYDHQADEIVALLRRRGDLR